MNRTRKDLLTAAIAVALLGAIGVTRWLGPSAADAEPYHARVRAIIDTMPKQIGNLVSEDEPLLTEAVDLLQSNVAIHRVYRDLETGSNISLLLVQCKDARNLAGHYPPICYPGQGWRLDQQTPARWSCGGMNIEGIEYGFTYGALGGSKRIVIANFMLLPDGTTAPDMNAVYRIASDYKRRFFGAAQVQIVSDARLPGQQRDRLIRQLLEANAPAFRLILSGDKL